jgi:DNA-binding LacI/PurR family transcriptional regulator
MTGPKSATLMDVARLARVSTATVSRVVNSSGTVRSVTRSRVLRAIEELDYRPDERARALARGESRTLGMIVSNLKNDFFLDIFQALEGEARRWGYDVVVANTDYHAGRLVSCVRSMVARRVAGLALVVTELEPELAQELGEQPLPVVLYDVGLPAPNVTKIQISDYQSTRRIVEYLYTHGHRRFAFVGHHTGHDPLQARQRAFLEAMRDYGSQVSHKLVADSDSPYGGLRATRQILGSGFRPTAVVCLNDYMALGVLKGLREAGLEVPRDVSVTGFDDVSLAKFANPALTTMAVPRDWIGRSAAAALIPDANGGNLGREIQVDPELLIRESTGPAPTLDDPVGDPVS